MSGDMGKSDKCLLVRGFSGSLSSDREFRFEDGEDVAMELVADSGVGMVGADERLRRFRGAMGKGKNYVNCVKTHNYGHDVHTKWQPCRPVSTKMYIRRTPKNYNLFHLFGAFSGAPTDKNFQKMKSRPTLIK